MIETIPGLPDGVIGVRAVGLFAVEDFAHSVEPLIEQAEQTGAEIRLVVHLGTEFRGFGDGPWGDLTSRLVRIPFYRGAMVTDDAGLATGLNLMKWTLVGDVRTFGDEEFDQAVVWVTG